MGTPEYKGQCTGHKWLLLYHNDSIFFMLFIGQDLTAGQHGHTLWSSNFKYFPLKWKKKKIKNTSTMTMLLTLIVGPYIYMHKEQIAPFTHVHFLNSSITENNQHLQSTNYRTIWLAK